MTTPQTASRPVAALGLVVAVCLVAANMRLTITAVGPLLDRIGADTGLSSATLGFLASVPLLAWGIVSPFAFSLSRRIGMSRAVLVALVALMVGTVVRSLPGPVASLWIGTVLIGVALAIANVLMPAVVKRDFPGRVPLVMALYTSLLGGVGAIASGVAVPLALLGDERSGWRLSLAVTGLALLPIAAVVWAWATRRPHAAAAAASVPRGRTGVWRDPVAWLVAAYMGLQASVFYMMLTWLASIAQSIGRPAIVAGVDVMVFQLFTIAGSALLPLALRGRATRLVPSLIPAVGAIGVAGLAVLPGTITAWSVLIGLASGASLSMSLTLMAERARDHHVSAALSGMAQSVGYIIAAIGPVVFGALHGATGSWGWSLGLVLLVLAGQAAVGVSAGRDRFVGDPRPSRR